MKTNDNYLSEWERPFLLHRPYLISFAFRMTGSLSEAEDLVQDALIECAKVNPAEIQNHQSWLTKVCSNKALDYLKSAAKKRETYPGTWLPDAIPDSYQIWASLTESESPEKKIIASESLTTSFLLLAERLSPEERVVYLLSEVFDYSHAEIAGFLNKSEDASRKIAQRARQAVIAEKPKFNATATQSQQLITQFFETAKKGDHSALALLLSEKSEFWADGGGKVPAASSVLSDKEKIALFFSSIGKAFNSADFKLDYQPVNFRPGLVVSRRQASGLWDFETIFSFEIVDDQIVRIYAQRNPDKLKALSM